MSDDAKKPAGTPYDVATHDPATGHYWVKGADLAPWYPGIARGTMGAWVLCLGCWVIRRCDGTNGPCRGVARIGLRGDTAKGDET